MSLLIKGMTMPETCMYGGCPIDGKYCDLWWKMGGGEYGRHRDCPLIELPEHGDLIDRDKLIKSLRDYACKPCKEYGADKNGDRCVWCSFDDAFARIEKAKTVIPAERNEAGLCDDCDERNVVSCSRCRRMERSEE